MVEYEIGIGMQMEFATRVCVQFVNQTQFPVRAIGTLNPHFVAQIPVGDSWIGQGTDGEGVAFFNESLQPLVFTSKANTEDYGYYLLLRRRNVSAGPVQVFFVTAPSEVRPLKDLCVEPVLDAVQRSPAKIDQLPLPLTLIASLKEAVENPSGYLGAKQLISTRMRDLQHVTRVRVALGTRE